MCLYTKVGTKKIAEEDIHVWKAVAIDDKDAEHWMGSYLKNNEKYPYETLIEFEPQNEETLNLLTKDGKPSGLLKIGKGFLFSTNLKSEANYIKRCAEDNANKLGYKVIVTEAIIPKGSYYYDVKFDITTHYASSTLIVHRPTNPEEQSFFVKHKPDVEQPCAC